MSFFSNPENNALKTILIVVVIASAGIFVFKDMNNSPLGDQGQVIGTTTTGSAKTGVIVTVVPPTVVTGTHSNYGTAIVFRGSITATGGAPVTMRGFILDGFNLSKKSTSFALGNYATSKVAIVENKDLPYLTDIACGGADSSYQAFAKNSAGIGYGAVVNYKTPPCPKVVGNGSRISDDTLDMIDDTVSGIGKTPPLDGSDPSDTGTGGTRGINPDGGGGPVGGIGGPRINLPREQI